MMYLDFLFYRAGARRIFALVFGTVLSCPSPLYTEVTDTQTDWGSFEDSDYGFIMPCTYPPVPALPSPER